MSGSSHALQYRRSVADAGWSALAVVTPDDTLLRDPRLRVSPEGAALLTWHGYSPPTFEEGLHATWLHPERWVDATLALYEYNYARCAVALAVDGGAIAAWALPSPQGVQTANFSAGAWNRMPSVEQDGGARGTRPTVDLDLVGMATLRWLSFEQQTDRVWTARSAGAGWGAPALLDEAGNAPTFLAQESNGRGEALVAWLHGPSMVVLRTDGSADVVDTIEGLILRDREPPTLAMGPSGAKWILANADEPGWRAVAMFCR